MISVIIPNYNGIEHLKDCFDSLRNQSYKEFRIILVDNNSTDKSIEFTKTKYAEVSILTQKENTGFARAVNDGIKLSIRDDKTNYILLLNNDIECDKNFIQEMLAGFISDDVGAVACKMKNFYNRDFIDAAGDFIKYMGSPFARGHKEKDTGQYDNPEYVFGASAGAAIYRKDVFDKIGYFDEDFISYYEDVDFCFRMQLAGLKCYYNPKAICYHKRGATAKKNPGMVIFLCEKNLVALRIKNYPASMFFMNLPMFYFGRAKRYFLFIRDEGFASFIYGIKGYFRGLLEIPRSIKKRKKIQKNRKVSIKYLRNLIS